MRRSFVEPLERRALCSADVVIQWNNLLLDAIRAERTSPPVASRNLAIMHTAVYDAVNTVHGGHEAYLVHRGGPHHASAEAAAAVAAHDTLSALYPSRQALLDVALAGSLDAVPNGPAENKGVALGRVIAMQVLASRADDGWAATVPYVPGSDVGDWQPTPPAFAPALLPGWGAVTPFAMSSGSQFRPDGPPSLDSDAYAAAFEQVKSLGSAASATRTAEQTDIARFWADGAGTATPPGHWNVIAQDLAEAAGNDLAENARLFAMINVAMADAAISCWDAKFTFDFFRPVTAIRAADDGNDTTASDPTWAPLIATPPFPAYTSGHSTFSAAAATVLARYFGTDTVSFTTTSDGLPGVERSFTSLSAAADEAGMSRIYGGIHWIFDSIDGLECGRLIGNLVVETLMRPESDVAPQTVPAAPVEAATFSLTPDDVLDEGRDVLA